MQYLFVGLAAVVLAVGVPFALGRAYSVVATRRDLSSSRVERALFLAFQVPMLTAFVAGLFAGAAATNLFPLVWPSIPVLLAVVVSSVVSALVTMAGSAAWFRGLEPLRRHHRGEGPTVTPALRWRRRLLGFVGAGGLALLVYSGLLEVGPVAALSPVASPVTTTMGLLVVGIAVYVWLAYPLALPFTRTYSPLSRDPTPAERTRIERAYERFERSPPRIRVRPGAGFTAAVTVAGSGSLRTITVDEPFLTTVDDDGLTVAVAQADERSRRPVLRHLNGLQVALMVALVWLVAALAGTGALAVPLGVVGLLVVLVLGLGYGLRSRVYAADRVVASRLGPDTVRRTYRSHGERLSEISRWWRGLPWGQHLESDALPEPPIEKRIGRLEAGQ